ncbi:hypothetical protein [Kribbella caucasensis]|uniref:hypothetical protein n=1 Tax=Kribbella caucasensis TaxID=2512215 RepID=UPI00105DA9E9|nr:hypothetical protein [Kribbella sp. VKM Ac-2527]
MTGLAIVAALLFAPLAPRESAAASDAGSTPSADTAPVWKAQGGDARTLDLSGAPVSADALAEQFRAAADTVSLTIRHLDQGGALTADAATAIANLDGTLNERIDIGAGEVTLHLPRGRYMLASVVHTGPADEQTSSFLIQPLVELQTDSTVQLDARGAKPLRVSTEDSAASSFLSALYVARRMDDGTMIQTDLRSDRLDRLTTAQLGPDVPAADLTSSVVTYWGIAGPAGDFADSPVTYSTLDTVRGRFFTGLHRVVRPAEMATVVSHLHSTSPDLNLTRSATVIPPGVNGGWSRGLLYRQPQTVTEYIEAGADTLAGIQERTEDTLVTDLSSLGSRTFQAGRRYELTWNKAVLGPNLESGWAGRYGDTMATQIPMYSDQAGNWSWGAADAASTRMYRDGVLIAETDQPGDVGRADVGPGPARFRLESHVDRPHLTQRSTTVDAVWNFSSDTAGKDGEPLPLWLLRFQPRVGPYNDAPSGSSVLPFTAKPNPGAKLGRVRLPVVRVSGDGGKSWRPATVVPKGQGRYVGVFALPGAKTISLRASAADSAGNTIDQTLLNAYAIR